MLSGHITNCKLANLPIYTGQCLLLLTDLLCREPDVVQPFIQVLLAQSWKLQLAVQLLDKVAMTYQQGAVGRVHPVAGLGITGAVFGADITQGGRQQCLCCPLQCTALVSSLLGHSASRAT